VAVASLGDFNGVAKASITDINGVTIVVSGTNLLLDTYTGAAAAYSVRKLDKDYTGSCMRIVVDSAATVGTLDSSDPEFDIGFDTNGDLDTAEIVTRCNNPSGNNYNAYVTKWYDQSGNGNDAAQTTHFYMPQIYNGSAVITENGKPALDFGGSKGFISSTQPTLTDPTTTTVVGNLGSGASASFYDGYGSSYNRHIITANGGYRMFAGTFLGTTTAQSGQILSLAVYNGASSELYANGNQKASGDAGTRTWTFGTIGNRQTLGAGFEIDNMAEMIVWSSNQSSAGNRSGIETDINNYYQIGNFPNPTSGLLATYTGAAAAYSVRQLANTASKCMRIVVDSAATVGTLDSSDPEFDIGFDSNGDLDTAAIVSYCNNPSGANYNAYVTKWYDQSGNGNDAKQNTHVYMPQIAAAGAVITENGKPAVIARGSNSIALTAPYSGASSTTTTSVAFTQSGQKSALVSNSSSSAFYVLHSGSSSSAFLGVGTPTVYVDGSLSSLATRGDVYTALSNNQSLIFAIADFNSWNSLSFGLNVNVVGICYQELIIWNTDQTSPTDNRSGIETDINNYFSIY